MGIIDRYNEFYTAKVNETLAVRSEATDDLSAIIAQLTAAHTADFTLSQALAMAPVARGVQILTSVGSTCKAVVYRDDFPLPQQPSWTSNPSAFIDRVEWTEQIIWSLVTQGNAYLRVFRNDSDGSVRNIEVLDPTQMVVTPDSTGLIPTYQYRGKPIDRRDLKHVAIGRAPGQLLGVSPITRSLDALALAQEADNFAMSFWVGNGYPLTIIKGSNLSADEAARLQTSFISARDKRGAQPFVTSKELDIDFPQVNAETSQMSQSRESGVTTAARVLGIPSQMLIVSTSGSTINYINGSSILMGLYRETLRPVYLSKIEDALTSLTPRGQVVAFDPSEITLSDIKDRMSIYQQGITSGIWTVEQVQRFEKLPIAAEEEAPSTDVPDQAEGTQDDGGSSTSLD